MKFRTAHGFPPGALADGRPFGPGEDLDLTREQINDQHNARLIAAGVLLAASPAASKAADDAQEGTR